MKRRHFLPIALFAVLSGANAACTPAPPMPPAIPVSAATAERVVIEGFAGGSEPLLMGAFVPQKELP